jgi:membrane associated rhomboid family serine protease
VNIAVIIITVLVSILAFFNREVFDSFKFNPFAIKHNGQGWRFLTYGLIHADWIHLFINMFVLYSFGKAVVDQYLYYFDSKGYMFYLLLYVGGIVFSVLFDYGKHKDDIFYNAVGASGAVSAVLFASILLHPAGRVMIFPIPFPLPSIVFGVFYLIYSAVMAKRGRDNVGHNAHFWGAVYGIAFTIAIKPAFAVYFWKEITNLF